MKKLKYLMFILMALFYFNGCQKELESIEKIAPDEQLLHNARLWFEESYPEEFALKSAGKGNIGVKLRPVWEKAKVYRDTGREIVETGITGNIRFGFSDHDVFQKWKSTGNNNYLNSVSKMVIVNDHKKKTRKSFIMTMFGDGHYLESKGFIIAGNRYGKWGNDFSGYVLYHNMDGLFVNGWQFADGKATHAISATDPDAPPGLKLKSTTCQTVNIWEWYQDCTTAYWASEGFLGFEENCGTPYMYLATQYTFCYTSPYTPLQGEYGGGDPYIGDTNGSLNNNLQKCLFKQITDQLISKNFRLGEIVMDPSSIGSGGIRSSGNLVFGNSESINDETLFHEWFHIAQWKLNGINIFAKENEGMAEFENALFQDIIETIRIGGNFLGSGTTLPFALYGARTIHELRTKYREEYQDWLKLLTQNGIRYPESIPSNEFLDFVRKFGEVSRSYNIDRGYVYSNNSFQPKTMISLFNSCN